MKIIAIVLTILLMAFFMVKLYCRRKKLFNKVNHMYSLVLIAIFSICFIGSDYGHQIYHNNHQSPHILHSRLQHPVEGPPSISNQLENNIKLNESKCPFCGVMLKIAGPLATIPLVLQKNCNTCNIAFYCYFTENITSHKQIRAPPIG